MSKCFFLEEWRDMGCHMEYCAFNVDKDIHVMDEQAPCIKHPNWACYHRISETDAHKIIKDYVIDKWAEAMNSEPMSAPD